MSIIEVMFAVKMVGNLSDDVPEEPETLRVDLSALEKIYLAAIFKALQTRAEGKCTLRKGSEGDPTVWTTFSLTLKGDSSDPRYRCHQGFGTITIGMRLSLLKGLNLEHVFAKLLEVAKKNFLI